jgi:serine/threonine protein kinase
LDDIPSHHYLDTLPPGTALGRYEIRRIIGRGGMGCVYEAVHRDLKKRVAIKTLLPSLAASPDARTRFLREGESASRIRHPHVVDVTDVGAEGSISYLVMEYLEGEDLSKLIARQGELPVSQMADIMLPVAAAISAAHDMGVIHRDLKPENIFLSKSTVGSVHPKVLDFGISKVTGDRNTIVLTGTGATFGTTFYLPPEQLQGARQADAKSDQYALGTIIYECVTGHRAFEGTNLYGVMKDIAEGRYISPRSRRQDLPEAVEAIVMRAMSLEPAERFASVKELGAALLKFSSPSGRILWEPTFTVLPEHTGLEPTEPPTTGGTMILPPYLAANLRPAKTPPVRNAGDPMPFGSLSTFSHASGESGGQTDRTPSLRPSRTPLFAAIAAIAVAGAVIAVMRTGGGSYTRRPTSALTAEQGLAPTPAAPRTFRVEIETDPHTATIEMDGRPIGRGALDERLPTDGSDHVIVVRAPGYQETIVRFTDRAPQHLIVLDPTPVTPPMRSHPAVAPSPVTEADEPKPSARSHRGRAGETQHGHGGKNQPRSAGSGFAPNGAPIIE